MAAQSAPKSPAVSDRKRRALDALERRYAVAKSPNNESKRESKRQDNAPLPKLDPASPTKGHLVFSYYPHQLETFKSTDEESHPAYRELPQMVHENLLTAAADASSRKGAIQKIVRNMLQSGDEGHKYISGARNVNIDCCILLDNFVPKDTASRNARVRALQSHSKRSRKHMSMRQLKKCGVLHLPKEFHNFNLFKPMHEMWKEYISELLKKTGQKQLSQCLLMADLHGAILLVVECKTTAYKGLSGIMIRETAETFGMISEDNRFRVVPKSGSVFIFKAGCWKITLVGDKLSLRKTGNR